MAFLKRSFWIALKIRLLNFSNTVCSKVSVRCPINPYLDKLIHALLKYSFVKRTLFVVGIASDTISKYFLLNYVKTIDISWICTITYAKPRSCEYLGCVRFRFVFNNFSVWISLLLMKLYKINKNILNFPPLKFQGTTYLR